MHIENYHLNRLERFEAKMVQRFPNHERVELHTIQVELSSKGLKFDHWSEKGVVTDKQYLMPSTHLRLSDILVARGKMKSKGLKYSVQVMFFEGDQELAQEVAVQSIQQEIQRDQQGLVDLSEILTGQRMI